MYQVLIFQRLQLLQVTLNWYMQGKQSSPGGMQGSKLIQLVSLSIPYYFRATSMHDMV